MVTPSEEMITYLQARLQGAGACLQTDQRRAGQCAGLDEHEQHAQVAGAQRCQHQPGERAEEPKVQRADVLGHRLIDVAAVQLVRAYDAEFDDTTATPTRRRIWLAGARPITMHHQIPGPQSNGAGPPIRRRA
jgi:hypothetical protein